MKIVIDDPVVGVLLTHLPRAARLSHTNRPFIAHLAATWRILKDWKMPTAVCRAGFLHSAYSTSFYPHALFTLADRGLVRRVIGREAEGLVFRFCSMDRRGFWDRLREARSARFFTYPDRVRDGAPVRVGRATLERLLIIESANIAEQTSTSGGMPAPWMSRVLGWWDFLDERSLPVFPRTRPRLTAKADREAIAAYLDALQREPQRALAALDRAITLNPWAGEPRVVRALCAREVNGTADIENLTAGTDLLERWAVSWDKRLSARAWRALADRATRTLYERRVRHPDFAMLTSILHGKTKIPRWLDL